MLSFKVSSADHHLISKIVVRACDLIARRGQIPDTLRIVMNIRACHASGNPLHLQDLLKASDADFMHDVDGIDAHICRKTGKLLNHFLPRFSVPEQEIERSPATKKIFAVGDSVTWTHCKSNGSRLSFSTRSGKIIGHNNVVAEIKLRNGRREFVALSNLRKEGERTELTEMFQPGGQS